MIQYPRTSGLLLGVLDAPPEPVIGTRDLARSRWRGMTNKGCAYAFPAKMFFTISMARRSKVIDASSVRNAAWDVMVTFCMCASG